jgi:light-regulated signal transduction histidine kinase (bacteriophytochrome)
MRIAMFRCRAFAGKAGMISKFEEALVNCSREPFLTPGAIRPFGVLLALDEAKKCGDNLGATQISQRTRRPFGASIL